MKTESKEQQYAGYVRNGGTMTMQQWENDSRYDPYLAGEKHGGEKALVEQIAALQKQLDECPDRPGEDASHPADAAKLWWILELHLGYLPGYHDEHYSISDTIYRDLALLGRIGQDVTFAHLSRQDNNDFGARNNAGKELKDHQYRELFFFIDRISSALLALQSQYQRLKV